VPGYVVRPLLVIALVGLAVLLGNQPTAEDALWAVLAACLMALVAQGLLMMRRQRRLIPRGESVYHTRIWARISLSFLMIEGFHLLLDSTDVVIVGQLLDPQSVAIYFAAIRTGGLIAFIYFAVSALAVPRIAQIHATGTREEMQLFVSGVIRLMFWPSVAAAVVLALIGPFALSLFGPEFGKGYEVLLVVLVGLVARAATGPVEYLLNMTGHEKDTVRVYAIAALCNIALNLLLIPQLGIIGAALSTYVAIIGANIWLCRLVRRRLGVVSLVGYSA
jgi:O-antigen/teichoic acid export membrane protein